MSLKSAKLVLQVALSMFNIACWVIPLRNRAAFLGNQSSISLANAFAAGVFLMLSLTHMLPHAFERWSEAVAAGTGQGQSTVTSAIKIIFGGDVSTLSVQGPLLCMVAGYLIVLGLDKVLGGNSSGSENANDKTMSGSGNPNHDGSFDRQPSPTPKSAVLLLLAMCIHRFVSHLIYIIHVYICV